MKNTLKVRDIMTKALYTIAPDVGIEEANRLFKKHKIRHLPVVSDGKLIGLLSLTDIMRVSFGDLEGKEEGEMGRSLFSMFEVTQLMNTRLITITEDTPIAAVAQRFVELPFHSLPVVKGEKLMGMITTTDVIKHFVAQEMATA